MKPFDVVVIGGGHAGCEAALAAARMGARTALVTLRLDRIGHMPCNPAVGGLAKGHLVKEIDALGGEIGYATDRTGIQFRMLNRGKGPAVWSPRAQVDKELYQQNMRKTVEITENLTVVEAAVETLDTSGERFRGLVLSDGSVLAATTCVLTAGTFLRGLMHTGEQQTDGGREGEPAAFGLAQSLRELGLRMGRLKTGTPPRVYRESVDLSALEPQPGDDPPIPFSHRTDRIAQPQVCCYLTHTTDRTHDIIRESLHRSPMYVGVIEGVGPRYCPSIEDKVVRFSAKRSHQIFVEPEGLKHPELYLNGISTSLPADVQARILTSIPGLETARMARPGYAVEYDYFPPDQLRRTMASKMIAGLYFAGQVNGTSGYEEAAAQGFVAGVNAVLETRAAAPFAPGRDEAYIGVMIDDLTTKEIDEPYRMFTSRAEFRLLLRQDNADERLMATGHALGLVEPAALARVDARRQRVKDLVATLGRTRMPIDAGEAFLTANGWEPTRRSHSLEELLRRPGVTMAQVRDIVDVDGDDPGLDDYVECGIKYSGYIERQSRDVKAIRKLESQQIPTHFAYEAVAGLSAEARQKLIAKRPETIGQASRIAGVRAADLSIIAVHVGRRRAG